MRSEVTAKDVAGRHDPFAYRTSLAERPIDTLPIRPDSIPDGLPVMLDTTFYIDRAAGRLPTITSTFVEQRTVWHSSIAIGEISTSLGLLDPSHPGTVSASETIRRLLEIIQLDTIVAPSPAAHIEAGLVAGILARTQHLNRPRKGLTPEQDCCQKGLRRKLLNDALLFLSAAEQGACLVSANRADLDRLLRFRPDAQVLLYQPLASPTPVPA